MKKIIGSAAVAAVLLSGCGGNKGTNPENNTHAEKTAYYVDSAVAGVHYECNDGKSGTTDKDGAFKFADATECTFSLAGIKLRTVNGDQLKAGAKVLEDKSKVAQLLQSLDTDGDPDKDGIVIDENAFKKALEKAGMKELSDVPSPEQLKKVIAKLPEVDSSYKGHFVSADEAKKHVEETKSEIEAEKSISKNTNAFSIDALKKLYAKTKIKEIIQGLDENDDGLEDLIKKRNDAKCESGKIDIEGEGEEIENGNRVIEATNCKYNKWKLDGKIRFDGSGGGYSDGKGHYAGSDEYRVQVDKNITIEHEKYGKLTVKSGLAGRVKDSYEGKYGDDDQGNSFDQDTSNGVLKGAGILNINGVEIRVAKLLVSLKSEYAYKESGDSQDENITVTLQDALFMLGDYVFAVDKSKTNTTKLRISSSGDAGESVTTSGAIHLKDGAGHAVEIGFVDDEAVVLKVDENGDGTFDDDETLTIDQEFIGD